MRELEEDNLLKVCEDLLQLMLVVEEGVVEGHPGGHSIHLDPQTHQIVVLDVRPPSGHFCTAGGQIEAECESQFTRVLYDMGLTYCI